MKQVSGVVCVLLAMSAERDTRRPDTFVSTFPCNQVKVKSNEKGRKKRVGGVKKKTNSEIDKWTGKEPLSV